MAITIGKVKVSGAAFLAAAAVYFYESGAMLLAIAAATAILSWTFSGAQNFRVPGHGVEI